MPKRAILPIASAIVISLVYYGTINNQKRMAREEVRVKHLEFVRKQINIIDKRSIPPDSTSYYNGWRACLSSLTDSLIVE